MGKDLQPRNRKLMREQRIEITREKVKKSEKKRGNQWYNSIIRLIEE